jgi:putative hydrolase of the HAD superfamily
MPEVIVFDLYGVIARTQTPAAIRRIEEIAGTPGPAFWDAYWADVAARLGTRFPDVPALIEADLGSWTDVDDEMVALVHDLADEGRTLGLLSNIIGDLVPRFEARHGAVLDRFDALVYSCRIGVAKPDPRAYEICAERLGVKPGDVLFFDDTERNVHAARAAGMRAELFTGPAQIRALAA